MAPTATPSAPAKTRNPPKLFSVSGTADGIKTDLSNPAEAALVKAVEVLYALAAAPNVFPRARDLAMAVGAFIEKPTAAAEKKEEPAE